MAQRTTLGDLPVELLELISSHIDSPQTVAYLKTTCKAFDGPTENSLYGSVLIHHGKMNAFATAVDQRPRRQQLVRSLNVDYPPPTVKNCDIELNIYSACTFAPLFTQFTNVESLRFASGWHDFDEGDERAQDEKPTDRLPTNWEHDHKCLDDAFLRASLLKAPEHRIWKNLRTITLDFWEAYEDSHQGCFFVWHTSVFLIDTLEELVIRGMRFQDTDGQDLDESSYRGTTQLKKLTLERSAIHHQALERFLSMPRALTHITLEHVERYEAHYPGTLQIYSIDLLDWDRVFEKQKDSLEFVHLDRGPWHRQDFLEKLGRFSNLRELEIYESQAEDKSGGDVDCARARNPQCEIRLFHS